MVAAFINLEVFLIIVLWSIHNAIILTKVNSEKKIHWYDRIFVGPHQTENYRIYKQLCKRNNVSLLWFYVTTAIVILLAINLVVIGIIY